ncbi:hypothetical protein TNCT_632881 [Trichonephila clavata]|uniref:Uncharacterized protein n=1 Tax=Trichonephila clavata TaxID=2740835 RepID=A0A8X6K9U8_TRICU|nr:hypothetical protein TNCT_632881 [Trichonephila clavata]
MKRKCISAYIQRPRTKAPRVRNRESQDFFEHTRSKKAVACCGADEKGVVNESQTHDIMAFSPERINPLKYSQNSAQNPL